MARILVMKVNFKLVGNDDLRIVAASMLYILAAQIGVWLVFPGIEHYPVFVQSGVALALMVLLGNRVWPGILIGSLITSSLVFIAQGITLNAETIIAISSISLANVMEALIGFKIYKLFIAKEHTPYEKASNTFKFLFLTLIIAAIGSFAYTYSIQRFQTPLLIEGVDSYVLNYLAEISGLWLFTNLILAWAKGKTHWKITWQSVTEATFFLLAIGTMLYIMNRQNLPIALERSFPFLIIPFLLWVTFRSSIQMATTVVFVIALFSVYMTINGMGPFVLNEPQNSLLLLQLFVIVIAITTVMLSATVYERTEAKKKLEKFNENLEAAVTERTNELNEEIKVRERTEKKIRVSNDELRKTNEELDNFVYKVSHDLRAPISSILGLVNVAKMDNSTDNMLFCLDKIEESASTQDDFIKDIIELTKNSRVAPKRKKIDFEKLIDETFEYLKYSLGANPVKPKLHLRQNKNFYSDPNRLKVIFNNIISNSIKYSKSEKTEIDVHVDVSNGHAKIDFEDKGIGIEKKYHEDVFKMFFRATDANAGSGLGLYIVKETVEKLKGDILLESEVNKGSTFKIKLPNMAPQRTPRGSKSNLRKHQYRKNDLDSI